MDGNQKSFIEDTLDLVNELDEGLMQLEANPMASAPLEQVFRTMHTIKGAANMFGFENIGELAHHLETLFDMVRQGRLHVSDRLISITLNAFDKVRYLLQKKDVAEITEATALKDHLELVLQFAEKSEGTIPGLKQEKNILATYLLRVTPTISITADGNHPLIFIMRDIETMGTSKMACYQNQDLSVSHWSLVLSTTSSPAEIESYFIFVENECTLDLVPLGTGNLWDVHAFEELVVQFHSNEIDHDELKVLTEKLSRQYPDSNENQEKTGKLEGREAGNRKELSDTVIKVSKRKIDDLLNWTSELIILQSQLLNVAQHNRIAWLEEITERMEMVTSHLRDTSLQIGLVPIESLVTQFKRLARDLSKSLGKKVNFLSTGTETEMDKDVIEMMTDPLLHLIRNAIDHGIEVPEVRRSLSKPEHGIIRLKAYRSSTFINLIISDDGKGIDKEKVIRKAVEKGIIEPDAHHTDEEIFNLIFHAGLSTSQAVSDISGRGVGMDVVNKKVSELKGTITIASSPGEGTSFHIRLPMSRSIIDGLLVRVANTHYVVPLNVVDRIDRVPYTSIHRGQRVFTDVMVNDEPLQVFSMHNEFYPGAELPKTADIISITVNGIRKGIAVDSIKGKMQAVLKPLGEMYQQQDFISGSTILGDGSLALILDPQRLFMIKHD
ncbi:MAG TPA: chemotaxis protein CheA [Chryseosolibacter sp.]|nr:chemotaxis protein CheA [Chryseosolibacter sp.]